jgi:cytidylate kinase
MIVAIDGPAGAGKSSVSRLVAERLGFVRLDTGALYRAVALAARRAGLPPDDDAPLDAFVSGLRLEFQADGRLVLDGEDVSDAIRTPTASADSSRYAAVPAVRRGLLDLQRRLGRARDSVVDGRDIGTVVFPDADVKIFLTASDEERARRRHAELIARGQPADFEAVLDEIRQRDARDSGRAVAPLRRAPDAHVVDTTHLDLEQAVAACLRLVPSARR